MTEAIAGGKSRRGAGFDYIGDTSGGGTFQGALRQADGGRPHRSMTNTVRDETLPFVDAVAPTGAAMCVVDLRKTKLKAGHAAKTDRLDARRLADAHRRDSVVSIYMPPPDIRALRELCRGRQQLVRLRTRLAQMIRALLSRCDAGEPPGSTLFAARTLAWLATGQRGRSRGGAYITGRPESRRPRNGTLRAARRPRGAPGHADRLSSSHVPHHEKTMTAPIVVRSAAA